MYSDHKPLQTLFNPQKSISTMASQRIQCWTLTLATYDYPIKYRPGNVHANADALSRLPIPDVPDVTPEPPEVILMLEQTDSSPITVSQVRTWSQRDPVLLQVCRFLQNGYPSNLPSEFQPFITKKDK